MLLHYRKISQGTRSSYRLVSSIAQDYPQLGFCFLHFKAKADEIISNLSVIQGRDHKCSWASALSLWRNILVLK